MGRKQISNTIVADPSQDYAPEPSGWVETLVDCPGAQGLYTYRVPSHLRIQVGDILSVPFGHQQIGAIAVRCLPTAPPEVDAITLRWVEDVVAQGFFPSGYWGLLHRVADYYQTPLMSVVRVALPPGLLRRSQRRIRLCPRPAPSPQGRSESSLLEMANLSSSAQQLLTVLTRSKTRDLTWLYLRQQVPGAKGGLQELLQQQWVTSYLESPTPVRPKQRQAVTLLPTQGGEIPSPRQQEVLEVLKRYGGDLWLTELLQLSRASASVVKGLAQKGMVVIQPREVLRSEAMPRVLDDQPKSLSTDQARAVEVLTTLLGYAYVLLHGVTGSGKTEVYLQTMAHCLNQGKSVLLLVPEIGLTPQLTDRVRQRFQRVPVLLYHSALSDGERYDTWRQTVQPCAQIVIGTRSAVFAPLSNLGLIILDEEHDDSFKQDQPTPCYHARTVAQWRAMIAHCPLVLGSATPCLETWVTAYPSSLLLSLDIPPAPDTHYLALPERIHARPMPPISVVDMRQELHQGNRSLFSRSLQTALLDLRDRQQQGILFIHRRGHSTFVSCRSCGYVLECPHCDVSLAYHHSHDGAAQLLRCHYCNHTQAHPPHCPQCHSPYLKQFGSGTQRIMQELERHLPDLRCLRYDSDTTRTKGAHRALLSRFAAGEADILVGTQMLTKGIDLPQVTLVGVMVADGLLHRADFRASERSLQTLTQVAGRCGRGDDPGQVIIQTYSPEHPVIQAVQSQDYAAFMAAELEQRSAFHYPPVARLLLLRLSSPDPRAVEATARRLAATLHPGDDETSGYEVLGPVPAPILRVAQRYRWHIVLKQRLQPASTAAPTAWLPDLEALRSLCGAAVSLTIDVDPLHLS